MSERVVAPHVQEHVVEVFKKIPQGAGVGRHQGADFPSTEDLGTCC